MARSAARIRSNDPAPVRPRAIVRDFSRSGSSATPEVEFDVRTVYDFVFSLSEEAGSVDDLPAPDRAWLAEARTTPARRRSARPSTSTGWTSAW